METTTTLDNILRILKGGKGPERFRFAFCNYDGKEITMQWDLTKYCEQTVDGWGIWMTSEEAIIYIEGMQELQKEAAA